MRRINLFLILLVVSLVGLAVVVVVGVADRSSSPWNWYWMGGIMGGSSGMMGGNGGVTPNPAAVYFWVAFLVLIGVLVAGVVGVAYYAAVPEIRVGAAPVVCETTPKENVVVQEQKIEQMQEAICTPLESIVKTLS